MKWMAVAGVVVLGLAPATAMAKNPHHQLPIAKMKHQDAAAPPSAMQTMALGAGYAAVNGSASVRALQRKLTAAGYTPGPLDGVYGPRTEWAVINFQAAQGLQVDGIAGPQTLAVLARPTLYPGLGYADVHGAASVRALQRRLTAAGYAPGPLDGVYGPRTERAVINFQATQRLQVDGIAGLQTFAALRSGRSRATIRATRTSAHPSPATTRRRAAPAGGRRAVPKGGANARPTGGSVGGAATRARRAPGSNPPIGWLLFGVLGVVVLLAAMAWTRPRRRREARRAAPSSPQSPPAGNGRPPPISLEASTGRYVGGRSSDARDAFDRVAVLEQQGDPQGAVAAYRSSDQLGHLGAASSLGVLVEDEADFDAAEAAYRRAAEGGDANGAFKLAGLLEERGALEEAIATYRQADWLGHAAAAGVLGALLKQQGDLAGAEAAYRRADARGDASGAFNLGLLLERRSDMASAIAAYQRAVAYAAELSASADQSGARERS